MLTNYFEYLDTDRIIGTCENHNVDFAVNGAKVALISNSDEEAIDSVLDECFDLPADVFTKENVTYVNLGLKH